MLILLKALSRAERGRLGGTQAATYDRETDTFHEKARKLHEQGKLTEKALRSALDKGDNRFVIAGLAVLADLPLSSVGQICRSKSANAVMGLAWKAE
jgi:hypothetical protein